MQKIYLIGNVVREPDVRSTPNGITVCSFTIAVDRKFKDAQGEKKTDYFACHAWRALGDVCAKFLSKGKKIAVIGELQARTYEAKDGTTRMSLDVQADEVEFLSAKDKGEAHDEPAPDANGFTDVDASDVPF